MLILDLFKTIFDSAESITDGPELLFRTARGSFSTGAGACHIFIAPMIQRRLLLDVLGKSLESVWIALQRL